jgi:hypothetical protein
MKDYTSPEVRLTDEAAEGVYAASGEEEVLGSKCDSVYMKGIWQGPDYSDWAGGTRGYKDQFGCLGCRANTATACGLQTHYIESGEASSYDDDDGIRMPSWEQKGYGPNDVVTDWSV